MVPSAKTIIFFKLKKLRVIYEYFLFLKAWKEWFAIRPTWIAFWHVCVSALCALKPLAIVPAFGGRAGITMHAMIAQKHLAHISSKKFSKLFFAHA